MDTRQELLSVIEQLPDEQLSVLLDLALSLKSRPSTFSNKITGNDMDELHKQKLIEIEERLWRKPSKHEQANQGDDLLIAKQILGRGKFEKWLQINNWNSNKKQAERFMNVAKLRGSEEFGKIFEKISNITSLYEIAQQSTPTEAKREIINHIECNKKLSFPQVKSIIKHHKELGAETVYGFIYLSRLTKKTLSNKTIYKIGSTSRDPKKRLKEIGGELIHSIQCKNRWKAEEHLQTICISWHFKDEDYVFTDEIIVEKICLIKTYDQLLKRQSLNSV